MITNRTCAVFLSFLLAAGFVAGCSGDVASLDGKDREDLLVRDAVSKKNAGNIEGALQSYGEALDRHPKLAVAHLDMAILFHDYQKDYLRAIYHYERYLELRPKAEKKKIIEDRIRLAGLAYAAKVAGDNTALAEMGRMSQELTELKKENDTLKRNLQQTSLQLEQAKSRPVVAPVERLGKKEKISAPIVDDVPVIKRGPSKTGVPRVHRVKKGDRLTSIALEYYRDARRADDIFKANTDKLRSPNDLREGQELVIPQ